MNMLRVISHPFVRLNIVLSGFLWTATATLAAEGMFDKIKSGAKTTVNYAYGGSSADFGSKDNLVIVLSGVINIVLTLIGIVFFGLLLYSGWLWMTAKGDSGKIDRAKQITREVVIGLIIIFLARLISEFIFRSIGAAIDQS